MRQAFPVIAVPSRGVRAAAVRWTGGRGGNPFWPWPRIRRPLDAAGLLLAAAALAVLVVAAVADPSTLIASARWLPTAKSGFTRFLFTLGNVVASFAILSVLVAIAIDALRRRRFALTSAALAGGTATVAGLTLDLVVPRLTTSEAAAVLLGPGGGSAALPVTAAVALVLGADLQRRRWLAPARVALAVAVGCSLGLGGLTLPSAAYAVLVGVTAGLAVRVAVGVVPAHPPEDLVKSVLDRAGWSLTGLIEEEQGIGRSRYLGRRENGDDVVVTVIDPDLRGVGFVRRAWTLLRLRTAAVGRPALSLRGQLERRALCGALAQEAGVATPRVLALLSAGPALVQVERPLAGRTLAAAGAVEAPVAERAWSALRRLHDAGIAHGALTPDSVVLLPHGDVGFGRLASAQPAATDLQREIDAVALLVAIASHMEPAQAVAAMRDGYGTTPVAQARLAALLQPLALPRAVRRRIRGTPLLGDLRTALADEAGAAPVEAPRLERLRARTVVSVVAGTAAAYVLAGQLSKVDVAGALAVARPWWIAVALLGAALTFVGAALIRQAFSPVRLPLLRTTLVQLASSFLTLVTPPAVGHVGLNIRYFQRSGVPTPTAAGTVAVSEAITVAVSVLVLLVSGWLSGVSQSRLALLPSGNVLAVLVAAAAVLALVTAIPQTRRLLRRRLEPLVRGTLPQLVASASDPRRLGTAIAGVLVQNAGFVLALDASLRSFSASLPIPTLVVVQMAAATLGSAAPTPGGLGAVEAALVAALTATGIPVGTALTAVLVFRAATFWIPAPFGWVTFVGLQRRGYV
jgi:uncharacterized membrane protein YbhN (UPF0104 family)/tRNA A-37 threonylcarbamoyl transferase component Bud32